MTDSSKAPESRRNCSAAGTRASVKAKRSRRATGEERWLRPITRMGMDASRVVNRGEQIASPKSQKDKNEAADRAEGQTTSALGKLPMHQHQAQVKEPDQDRPDDFRIN